MLPGIDQVRDLAHTPESVTVEFGIKLTAVAGVVVARGTLLRHDRPLTGYVPTGSTPWLTALAERSPFAASYRPHVPGQQTTDTTGLREQFQAMSGEERSVRLRRLIREHIEVITRYTVAPDRPFNDYGLDSLANLELRTRIEKQTGLRLTPRTLTTHHTVRSLATFLDQQRNPAESVSTSP